MLYRNPKLFKECILTDYTDEYNNYGPPLFQIMNPESNFKNFNNEQRLYFILEYLDSLTDSDKLLLEKTTYNDINYYNRTFADTEDDEILEDKPLSFYKYTFNIINTWCSDNPDNDLFNNIEILGTSILKVLRENSIFK